MSHVLMGVTGSNKTPSCRGCRGRSLVMFSWWFVSTAAAAKRVKSSLCLHIRPLVFEHCSSFTQTLILLRTSVRLHQYGEDEASLGFLFLFLKRKNSRQHNRSDDSLAVLQLETWTEFCPVSGEGGGGRGTDGLATIRSFAVIEGETTDALVLQSTLNSDLHAEDGKIPQHAVHYQILVLSFAHSKVIASLINGFFSAN